MGWGVSWQAAFGAKSVAIAFNVLGISKDRNNKDGNILELNLTQLKVLGEAILGYL